MNTTFRQRVIYVAEQLAWIAASTLFILGVQAFFA
jgi:hypothetical protein